jgi:hydroxylaminobenzene mutase
MRHPDDPDIAPNSKAAAAFSLGVLGVATGLLLGGLIPATVALLLARQARADIDVGAGWQTGHRQLIWARRLAWTGIGLAFVAISTLVMVRLLQNVGGERDFPPTVD